MQEQGSAAAWLRPIMPARRLLNNRYLPVGQFQHGATTANAEQDPDAVSTETSNPHEERRKLVRTRRPLHEQVPQADASL
jgi:hypothetical protein